MICPRCNAENPEGARYCGLCYEAFEAGTPQKTESGREGARTRTGNVACPNCGAMGSASLGFCGRCGFAFEGYDLVEISAEDVERVETGRSESLEQEARELKERPYIVDEETDGGELMRRLFESLANGYRPRIRAAGREPIALAMKLLARLEQELQGQNKQLWLQPRLLTEEPVRYLDELEIEMILAVSAKAG